MGNCMGTPKHPDNVFKVTNINDDKNLVQKGYMEVTDTELIYTDNKSDENWRWPLRYLRKYGCDGDVFSFEAGRKCPGGEGLYAFSAHQASLLFDMVARNINQGGLQPQRELSPFSSDSQVPDSNILNFPPRRKSSTQSPTQTQPSYTNLDLLGNPLENGSTVIDQSAPKPDSPDTMTNSEPKKFVYREVIFEKPPEDHPAPPSDTNQTSSYTQIDFDKTDKYNRERRLGALPSSGGYNSSHHNRTSSSSLHGNSPTKHHRRHRIHTYSSGGSKQHRSTSDSSFSSQSSLTESSRDVRDARSPQQSNGAPRSSVSDPSNPASSMYQNFSVANGNTSLTTSVPPAGPMQQYQNVQVGAGTVSQVFEGTPSPHRQPSSSPPHQQPNYANVQLSKSGNSSSILPSGTANGVNGITPIRVNGDPMGTYADLELSNSRPKKKRSLSTSTSPIIRDPSSPSSFHQSSYMELDFKKKDKAFGSSSNIPQPTTSTPSTNQAPQHSRPSHRSTSLSSVVPQSTTSPLLKMVNGDINHRHNFVENPPSFTSSTKIQNGRPEEGEQNGYGEVVDETKVAYGVLNFPAMEALSALSKEREEDNKKQELEREQRDRERSNTHGKKKK